MSAYVMLTAMLFQRGSAESRDPDDPARPGDELPPAVRKRRPILSIFLRHKGSPESKPVAAQNAETGAWLNERFSSPGKLPYEWKRTCPDHRRIEATGWIASCSSDESGEASPNSSRSFSRARLSRLLIVPIAQPQMPAASV